MPYHQIACVSITEFAVSRSIQGRSREERRAAPRAPRHGRRRRGDAARVPDRRRVDDPEAPAALERERAPVRVEPPPHPQRRERQQLVGHRRRKAVSGPISTMRVRRATVHAAAPEDGPGRMARVRAARAGRARSPKRSRDEQEPVEEAVRQLDVVVDRDHPVARRAGGALSSNAFRFSNFPWPRRPSSTRLGARARRRARRARRARSRPGAPARRSSATARAIERAVVGGVDAEHADRAASPDRAAAARAAAVRGGATSAASSPRSRTRARSRARRPVTIPLWPESTARGRRRAAPISLAPAYCAQPPRGVCGQQHPVAAAVAEDVEHAAGEHTQLAREAGRVARDAAM